MNVNEEAVHTPDSRKTWGKLRQIQTSRALARERTSGFVKPWLAVSIVVALAVISAAFGVMFGLLDHKKQVEKPADAAQAGPSDPSPPPTDPPSPAFPSLPLDHTNPGTDEMNALIKVVKAGRPADRVTAAHRIAQHARIASRAIPALLAALETADSELEAAVLAALEKIGPPPHEYVPLLVSALSSKSLSAHRYAVQSFAEKLPVPEEAIPALVTNLRDSHAVIRAYAATALERAGEKARPFALGPLVALGADLDPSVRNSASKAVKALGKPNPDDLPTLKTLLGDKSPQVRSLATSLISSMVTNGDQAAQVYVPLLTDMNPEIRLSALVALIAYPDSLPKVSASIFPLFKDMDKKVRSTAIGAAVRMQGAPNLSEEISSAFQVETDPDLHTLLADAFVRLSDPKPSDVKTLRAVLFDCPLKVRRAALDKLALLKNAAAPAVDDLITLVNDPSAEVRAATLAAALRALAAIGPDPKLTLPIATTNFNDKQASNDVRVAAIDLLASCGPEGLSVLKDATPYILPDPLKAEMCEVFASAGADAKDVYLWMIDTAETIDSCRPSVSDALAKAGNDKSVLELIIRTDKYRNRKPGEPERTYPLEYRTWALQTLGKMDLTKIKPETRARLEYKMKLITDDNEIETSLQRLAATVIKKLKN
jgi:HEAT repeat protein